MMLCLRSVLGTHYVIPFSSPIRPGLLCSSNSSHLHLSGLGHLHNLIPLFGILFSQMPTKPLSHHFQVFAPVPPTQWEQP